MKSITLALLVALFVSCAANVISLQDSAAINFVAADTCKAQCTIPKYDANFEHCDWYETQLDWLPTAYVKSAKCACLLKGLEARASPTASCVRNNLIASHKTVPDSLKQEMRDMKKKHCGSLMCSVTYLAWVEKHFIPLAYDVHVDAYKNCCCARKPAPLIYWRMLMLNYKGITPCSWIVKAIQLKGKCGCQNW
jgi:hypothetical protein